MLAGGAIPQGTFVSEYAGELVTSREAQQRLQEYDISNRGHALMVRGHAGGGLGG